MRAVFSGTEHYQNSPLKPIHHDGLRRFRGGPHKRSAGPVRFGAELGVSLAANEPEGSAQSKATGFRYLPVVVVTPASSIENRRQLEMASRATSLNLESADLAVPIFQCFEQLFLHRKVFFAGS